LPEATTTAVLFAASVANWLAKADETGDMS
jgi:hypothetical protein